MLLDLTHTTNSPPSVKHHVLAIFLMKRFLTAIFSILNEVCEILGSLFFLYYTTNYGCIIYAMCELSK